MCFFITDSEEFRELFPLEIVLEDKSLKVHKFERSLNKEKLCGTLNRFVVKLNENDYFCADKIEN